MKKSEKGMKYKYLLLLFYFVHCTCMQDFGSTGEISDYSDRTLPQSRRYASCLWLDNFSFYIYKYKKKKLDYGVLVCATSFDVNDIGFFLLFSHSTEECQIYW